MKLLIIFLFTLLAFNVFAAEEGENKKSDCPYANQGKREAKVVLPVETEIKKDAESSNIRQ